MNNTTTDRHVGHRPSQMIAASATKVIEVGSGNVLQGLFKKVSRELEAAA